MQYFLLCFCWLLMLQVPTAVAKEIQVVTGSYCPYTCKEGGLPGLGEDILERVLSGTDYRIKRIRSLPWLRDINLDRGKPYESTQYHAVIGVATSTTPGLLFPDLPIAYTDTCFFVRSASPWQYQSDNTEPVHLALAKNYEYGTAAGFMGRLQRLRPPVFVYGSELASRMLKLLAGRRVDAIYETASVVRWHSADLDMTAELKPAGCPVRGIGLYVAFNPGLPDAKDLLRLYNRRFAELVDSGEYQVLLVKYGLQAETVIQPLAARP